MKECSRRWKQRIYRIIAWVLTLSLIMIPVKFPGNAHAAGADQDQTALDMQLQWKVITKRAVPMQIAARDPNNADAGKVLHLMNDGIGQYGVVYWEPTVDSVDISKEWTDYTFTADVKRTGYTADGAGNITTYNAFGSPSPMFRISPKADGSGYTGYSVYLFNGSLELGYREVSDEEGQTGYVALASKNLTTSFDADGYYKFQITVKGNKITVDLYNAEGTALVETLTYTDEENRCPAGSVGFFSTRTKNQINDAYYDNVKIEMHDGVVIEDKFERDAFDSIQTIPNFYTPPVVTENFFTDDFSDARKTFLNWSLTANDGTNIWDPVAVEPVDTTLQWKVITKRAVPMQIAARDPNNADAGKVLHLMNDGIGQYGVVYLEPSVDGNDVSKDWTDYTFTADVKRTGYSVDDAGNITGYNTFGSPAPMFRISPKADGSGYTGYSVYLFNGTMELYYRNVSAEEGQTGLVMLATKKLTTAFNADGWYKFQITVKGNVITVDLYNAEGTALVETLTYTDEENRCPVGSVGFFSTRTKAKINDAYYDNVKIELDNGIVIEDKFERDAFDTAFVVEDSYTPVVQSPWVVQNQQVEVDATTITHTAAYVDENNQVQYWKNYSVEAAFQIEAGASASLINCVVGNAYFEMRIKGDKLELYKVGDQEELLATRDWTTSADTWHYAKLTLENNQLSAYLDGKFVISAPLPAGSNGTMGSAGLKAAGGKVRFANFAMYNAAGAEEYALGEYTFDADDTLADLGKSWMLSDSTTWQLSEQKLSNTVEGVAALRPTASMKNYAMTATVELPQAGAVSLVVRGTSDLSSGYALLVSLEDGLSFGLLEDTTPLKTVSREELYQQDIRLVPGESFKVTLSTYEGRVCAFINDQRVMKLDISDPLPAGQSFVKLMGGAKLESAVLEKSSAFAALSVVSMHYEQEGNELVPVFAPVGELTAPVGTTPEIKDLYLKVAYTDGTAEYIPLDYTVAKKLPVVKAGANSFVAEYAGETLVCEVTGVLREDYITALDADIAALPATITLDEKATVYELERRYDVLTAAEKATLTNGAKLEKAEEAIDLLQYPELVNAPVVYFDDFNTDTTDRYYNNYVLAGDSDPGNWYIENGGMLMYDNEQAFRTTSFTCSYEIKDQDFEVQSISVDVQLLKEKAWAGIRFNAWNQEFYQMSITDKSDRICLNKTGSNIVTAYANDDTIPANERIEFEVGQWYNLRVTFDNGLIKCYVNDKLWIEYQDVLTVTHDEILDHGAVSFYAAENYVKFDNLEIRGTKLEQGVNIPNYVVNPNLPQTEWSDDFTGETAGENPSHWLEKSTQDKWHTQANGNDLVYALAGNKDSVSMTWLHGFDTDVDFSAMVKPKDLGHYPSFALMARVTADESYIRAGYDFVLKKWYVESRYGLEFEPEFTYAENVTDLDISVEHKVRLLVEDTSIQVFLDDSTTPVVTADAGKKVSPGRVGFYADSCNLEVDDVKLIMLSGQGRINEGIMEQYMAQAGNPWTYFGFFELPDGTIVTHEGGDAISTDNGMTWQSTNDFKGKVVGVNFLELHNGYVMNVGKVTRVVERDGKTVEEFAYATRLSTDGGYTWSGNLGDAVTWYGSKSTYLQTGDRMSEVILPDGTSRVFFTVMNKTTYTDEDGIARLTNAEVYYTDDFGATWTMAKTTGNEIHNMYHFGESHIIRTTALEGNPLIQYSTHNSQGTLRYNLSYDNGETWVGDYAMPHIPCTTTTFALEEDTTNPGTYYMAVTMNLPSRLEANWTQPRHRVVLLRSTDGFNWDFMGDVDRWGDVSSTSRGHSMQSVNMYICVGDEYVYVTYTRSDMSSTDAHNLQVQRLVRFEKSKMKAYDQWPAEWIPNDKMITYIEAVPAATELAQNATLSMTENKIKVHYYDGTSELVDFADAFVKAPNTATLGEKKVVVDYKHFRTVFTVNVVEGDAPAMNVVDGKTYCSEQTVTVTDANGDLVSVTLNGQTVTLLDGKFTVSAKEGQQTIVATDRAGNVTTVKITVNAGHTGGEATCTEKAKCEVCGESYGELNADKHTKEAKWTISADKHAKAYECCGKVVVEEAAHTGGTATCEDKAVCSACNAEYGALAAHKGGEATCTDKAKCDVCGEAYGELNADKHTKEVKWAITADKHSKAYECCGKVVVAEEAHEWKDGKCEECGYEAELGTQQKPIEIPADKETVKEEAKVEAGAEQHYELDEKLSGKVITVKGEDAFVIVDGKKCEAVNGVVEVKLPTKTGKISVVIGNAGTKAGAFSITIATPDDTNSDTGDHAAIVLFGSLMALSVLAAGALLIPDIRKLFIK